MREPGSVTATAKILRSQQAQQEEADKVAEDTIGTKTSMHMHEDIAGRSMNQATCREGAASTHRRLRTPKEFHLLPTPAFFRHLYFLPIRELLNSPGLARDTTKQSCSCLVSATNLRHFPSDHRLAHLTHSSYLNLRRSWNNARSKLCRAENMCRTLQSAGPLLLAEYAVATLQTASDDLAPAAALIS